MMSNFRDAYSLSGADFSQWTKKKTEDEILLHLFEVGFRLQRVFLGKGKDQAAKQEDLTEVAKETGDLLILLKHHVLDFGGGEDLLDARHDKFRRRYPPNKTDGEGRS